MARFLIAILVALLPQSATAQMRLVVSAQAGGSYDHIGRLVARHLTARLGPIAVENMVGGSGRIAAGYLYRAAPTDCSVIGLIQQGTPMAQAIGDVQYDAAAFNWIGSPMRLDETLVVWHTTGIKAIGDARTIPTTIGATSVAGAHYLYPKLANELLGTRFKIVTGYRGGPEINMAMERGEVGGRGANPWSEWKATNPDWVRDGRIVPLMQMSLFKHPDLAHVPLLVDLAPDEMARSVFEVVSLTGEISRPFVAPPGVSATCITHLRSAFMETMRDPAFLQDAARAHVPVSPIAGEELNAMVRQVLGAPRDSLDLLRSLLKG